MKLPPPTHHLDLHAGHWHIEIIDDIVHVTRPTWATPDPVPKGRYRPPHHPPAQPATPTPAGPSADADLCRPGTHAGASWIRVWRPATAPRATTEDAARLDPWGDGAPTHGMTTREAAPAGPRRTRDAGQHPSALEESSHFDPWGEEIALDRAGRTGQLTQ